MELVYLWIEEYKNIKQQEFFLGSKFEIDCFRENNQFKFLIKSNDDYIDDFFDSNNKVDIISIVGKNGTGKSNILSIITDLRDKKEEIKTYFELYYDEYENRFLFRTNNNTINVLYTFDEKLFSCYGIVTRNIYFFSDILNITTFQDKLTKNISFWKKFNNEYMTRLEYDFDFTIDEILNKVNLDIKTNEVILIKKSKFVPGISHLPKNIVISFDHYNFSMYEDLDMKNLVVISFALLKILADREYTDSIAGDIESLEDYALDIEKLSFLDFSDEVNSLSNEVSQLFEKVRNFILPYEKLLKISRVIDNTIHIPLFNKKNNALEDVDNLLNAIDEINSYKDNDFCIKINWDIILSSGEDSILRFFSSIYEVIRAKEENDNIILVIDELENHIHPTLQTKIIKYIIDFFSIKELGFNGKVQIILTTHSPFILSDLPHDKVILLERKGDRGLVKNVTEEKAIKPFGENIHTLLSHGFFMSDGLIGEFSRVKIKRTIDDLNNKNIEDLDKRRLLNLIKSIGEEFLRMKLLDMYNKKFKISKEEKLMQLENEFEIRRKKLEVEC